MRRLAIATLALATVLVLVAPAAAQTKTAKCGNIQATVDVNDGSGWKNNQLELALLEDGGGWVISKGPHRGENCPAIKGQKLRFNFNDGANHPVNVSASTKAGGAAVKAGSRPAIVLVDVKGSGTRAAINFKITGAPNPKAKINGCPGGNFYLEIE